MSFLAPLILCFYAIGHLVNKMVSGKSMAGIPKTHNWRFTGLEFLQACGINMATDLSVGEGKIGFQAETAEIIYRNIEIKEFNEVIPMDKF